VSAGTAQCEQAGGYFWGRGVACNAVPALAPIATLTGCTTGDVGYGLPMSADPPAALNPSEVILRQPVEAGVRSIQPIKVAGVPYNRTSSPTIKVNGWPQAPNSERYLPATGLVVRVTVRFRDGGAPLVVDRTAVSQPYGPAGQQAGLSSNVRLITVTDILPAGAREVLSVSVQAAPEGLDCTSALRGIRWLGRNLAPADPGSGAEYSPDCGATWVPVTATDGSRFQAALCITR
jgi:hypothetical protein